MAHHEKCSLPQKRLRYNGILIPKEFPNLASPVERVLFFPREVLSMQLIILHQCYLPIVEDFLPSIWLYCDVGPSPNTSLSVSIVSMHATFMTFIIHPYLHHQCILAFFNVCFKNACLGYIYSQKQVWACHLSNRLSPISRKNTFFLQFPTEFVSHGRRLFQFLLSKQMRKSPVEFIPHWV